MAFGSIGGYPIFFLYPVNLLDFIPCIFHLNSSSNEISFGSGFREFLRFVS